eukprot:scaffold517_cov119-Cylindrotheca_fusiformis.AAC.14
MARVLHCLLALVTLTALSFAVQAGSPLKKPSFLPRRYNSSSQTAKRELETTIDCEAEESDMVVRFALQYEHEHIFLRHSESSYLLRDGHEQADFKVVPASMVQRQSKFQDYIEKLKRRALQACENEMKIFCANDAQTNLSSWMNDGKQRQAPRTTPQTNSRNQKIASFNNFLSQIMTSLLFLLLFIVQAQSFSFTTPTSSHPQTALKMTTEIKEIQTSDAPAPVGPYSQAVLAGGTLYCSGSIALNPATGGFVGGGNVQEEAKQCLKNMDAILKASGASAKNVVRCTVFLADLGDFAKVNEIYSDYFKDNTVAPSRSCVQAAALPKGALVEIDCIAVL